VDRYFIIKNTFKKELKMTSQFYGRSHELELFNDLVQKKTASLAVIKARRRVGKSRLIEKNGIVKNNFLAGKSL
jgi:hypothetical protein